MFNSFKVLSVAMLALGLSACASTPNSSASNSTRGAQVTDTSYIKVSENIEENIGLNVRWGGEIISSKKVGNATEFLVFSHPLSKDGRPAPWSDDNFVNGRFIVKVNGNQATPSPKYLTVYGEVSGEKTLVHGSNTKIVPVISAVESKEWNATDSINNQEIASINNRRSVRTNNFNSFDRFDNRGFNRFNSLGFSRFSNNSFGRFGNRSFSRFGNRGFGRFSNRGFSRFGNRGFSRFGNRGFGRFGKSSFSRFGRY